VVDVGGGVVRVGEEGVEVVDDEDGAGVGVVWIVGCEGALEGGEFGGGGGLEEYVRCGYNFYGGWRWWRCGW